MVVGICVTVSLSFFKPFHATGLFLYPLKTSENFWFSDGFRGYKNRPVAWNGLTTTAGTQVRSVLYVSSHPT